MLEEKFPLLISNLEGAIEKKGTGNKRRLIYGETVLEDTERGDLDHRKWVSFGNTPQKVITLTHDLLFCFTANSLGRVNVFLICSTPYSQVGGTEMDPRFNLGRNDYLNLRSLKSFQLKQQTSSARIRLLRGWTVLSNASVSQIHTISPFLKFHQFVFLVYFPGYNSSKLQDHCIF